MFALAAFHPTTQALIGHSLAEPNSHRHHRWLRSMEEQRAALQEFPTRRAYEDWWNARH